MTIARQHNETAPDKIGQRGDLVGEYLERQRAALRIGCQLVAKCTGLCGEFIEGGLEVLAQGCVEGGDLGIKGGLEVLAQVALKGCDAAHDLRVYLALLSCNVVQVPEHQAL